MDSATLFYFKIILQLLIWSFQSDVSICFAVLPTDDDDDGSSSVSICFPVLSADDDNEGFSHSFLYMGMRTAASRAA
jgi:hypothetical protein